MEIKWRIKNIYKLLLHCKKYMHGVYQILCTMYKVGLHSVYRIQDIPGLVLFLISVLG